MDIQLERRAEIAQRSLPTSEKDRIARALDFLFESQASELLRDHRVSKLNFGSGEQLYSFRSSQRLRLIFSIRGNLIVVQDIVDHDRLKRWSGGQG